jgi:hypothetical protein
MMVFQFDVLTLRFSSVATSDLYLRAGKLSSVANASVTFRYTNESRQDIPGRRKHNQFSSVLQFRGYIGNC